MKKVLPGTSSKGFTLVELLVAVAILAILSVIAVAFFGNAQKNARDAKRKAELETISNALEINKTATGYQPLLTSQFAGGAIPATDPQGIPYCISAVADQVNPSAVWTAVNGCPNGFSQVSATVPAVDSAQYKVCASLENGGGTNVACKSNQQ